MKFKPFLLFEPMIRLAKKLSFFGKFILLTVFLIIPLSLMFTREYRDSTNKISHIQKQIDQMQMNTSMYQMIFLIQDYENSARSDLQDSRSQEAVHKLKMSEEFLLELTKKTGMDEKDQAHCLHYFHQIELAFLNKDMIKLEEYTKKYKYFLYKKNVLVDVVEYNPEMTKIAYLLSLELPYASFLVTELSKIQTQENRLLHLGRFKGSFEKNDKVLKKLLSYTQYFEEDNERYIKDVKELTDNSLLQDTNKLVMSQALVLNSQRSLYKSLYGVLEKYLDEKRQNAKLDYYILLSLIGLTFFLFIYIFIGVYSSIYFCLKEFFRTSSLMLQGELDSRIEVNNQDEFGQLSHTLNRMMDHLEKHYAYLNEYKKAIDSSSIVIKTDKEGLITYVNEAFEKISGYNKMELIGSSHRLIRSKNTSSEQIAEMWKYINNKKTYKTIFENISKNGKSFFVESTIVPLLDNKAEIREFMAIMFDITPLYRQKEKLQSRLYKDELTLLPNRLKLIEDISRTKEAKLVVINIDGFKEINTIYGESIGDLTLQKMANEIRNALNTRHLQLYKLPADEFAILAGKEISIEFFKEDVTMLGHYLSHIKLRCAQTDISVRLSLGAVISELHDSQRPLISMADMALKEAKQRLKPYMFYNDTACADEDLEKNYEMVQIIEEAIKEDKVRCLYQGIINAKTGEIEKYETLMRLEDKSGNEISPQNFVDIAKKARYYPKLTQKLIQEALYTFINKTESVSINLSIDDILDDETYMFILDALRNCGCAHRVVFELLETEEIELNERVMEFTSNVKKLGVQIAIDDFGSGYSNYAYLMKLGVDIVKIDASLIKEIDKDEPSRLIVSSIIGIAHDLGMKTVVEHVHTKEVSDIMKEMGTDFLQGYFLHKPVSEF